MNEYEKDLYRIIGGMLREARVSKGFTLEQVSEKLGATAKTLQRYELGERKIKADALMELSSILEFDYLAFILNAKAQLAKENHNKATEKRYYYIDDETRAIAQEIYEDKDMKLLFDLKKTAQADRLMAYAKFLKEQYDKENGL